MIYHGKVMGPAGQVYNCEHNHRTETAAITCANSSATRQMAALTWARAAARAAQAAELARRRAQEQEAAEARRAAARAAEEARRAAARKAAEEAKAAKRAAKLAAMKPERAWKRMTPAERLLRTAEKELEIYGEIRSLDAKHAYDARTRQLQSPQPPPPAQPASPPAAHSSGGQPALPGNSTASDRGYPPGRQPFADGQPAETPHASADAAGSYRWRGFGGDGLYVVGLDIEPGVYRTTGSAHVAQAGYFALLKSTSTRDIINNGRVKGPATITVGPAVKAVEVRNCQPWQRLGDDLDAVIQAARQGKNNPDPARAPQATAIPLPARASTDPRSVTAYPAPGIPAATGVTPEVITLVSQGRKIQAIRLYRKQNPGVGLKEAKDIIDQIG